MKVAVLGATGHTGRMVVDALVERGARVRACGRDERALAALAAAGHETARVDTKDAATVRDAVRGVDAVANLAGPFLDTGAIPVEAALRWGVPYVDTTGEQAFMRRVLRLYDERAKRERVPIVQALAFEYALSDLAVAAHLADGGDALHVLYRPRGAEASLGTKKSIVRALAARAVGYEDGELVRDTPARHRRRFETREGPRDAMSFAGGEILTVPRHAPFRTVRTYVPAPPARARLVRAAGPLARALLRGPILRAVERRVAARHAPPRNDEARGEIHLVTGDGRGVLIETADPYELTAHLLAEGLVRVARAGVAGWLAPAEALDASETLAALRRRLPTLRVTPTAALGETSK